MQIRVPLSEWLVARHVLRIQQGLCRRPGQGALTVSGCCMGMVAFWWHSLILCVVSVIVVVAVVGGDGGGGAWHLCWLNTMQIFRAPPEGNRAWLRPLVGLTWLDLIVLYFSVLAVLACVLATHDSHCPVQSSNLVHWISLCCM